VCLDYFRGFKVSLLIGFEARSNKLQLTRYLGRYVGASVKDLGRSKHSVNHYGVVQRNMTDVTPVYRGQIRDEIK